MSVELQSTNASAPHNRINYEVLGAGARTVVLLHGWKQSLLALRPLGELLAEDNRVVLIDLPGFGNSPIPPQASNDGGGWGTFEYAQSVCELLISIGVERCTLVGHSLGGRVSVQIAALKPEIVESFVLIGAHGLPYERPARQRVRAWAIKQLVQLAKKVDSMTGTRFFPHYLAPRFGSRDYHAAGDLRRTLVKVVNEDLSAQARAIKAPALLIWGAEDLEAPLAIGRRYRELLASSELIVLPNRGHEPFQDVGSHLLATYIGRFLDGTTGGNHAH
jgi:pimeloyl-ACP methyl ester carboxylesterase